MLSGLPVMMIVITRVLIGSTSTVLFPPFPSTAFVFMQRKRGLFPLCDSSTPTKQEPLSLSSSWRRCVWAEFKLGLQRQFVHLFIAKQCPLQRAIPPPSAQSAIDAISIIFHGCGYKQAHLRNIYCPADVLLKHICCHLSGPAPRTPDARWFIACSVCTVGSAFSFLRGMACSANRQE